jgi:hypothetical protein
MQVRAALQLQVQAAFLDCKQIVVALLGPLAEPERLVLRLEQHRHICRGVRAEAAAVV